jgi:hypothetical protein
MSFRSFSYLFCFILLTFAGGKREIVIKFYHAEDYKD